MHEVLSIPENILGLISLRNSCKMQGLVNISGFHVDPTHKGWLVCAVNNVGPSDVRLRLMEPTFPIFFAKVQGSICDARDPLPDRLLNQITFPLDRGVAEEKFDLLQGAATLSLVR
jgi:hypothetical protein